MRFDRAEGSLDATDVAILGLLQENCKRPLAEIGKKVGLTAPSVVERIHKLEQAGVVIGYVALVDGRRVGRDVTAFIGVSTDRPRAIEALERQVAAIEDVLECHHVTGSHTLMVKAKTRDTRTLEQLIEKLRSIDGVTRTETMVVLSTAIETPRITLGEPEASESNAPRRATPGRGRRGTR